MPLKVSNIILCNFFYGKKVVSLLRHLFKYFLFHFDCFYFFTEEIPSNVFSLKRKPNVIKIYLIELTDQGLHLLFIWQPGEMASSHDTKPNVYICRLSTINTSNDWHAMNV